MIDSSFKLKYLNLIFDNIRYEDFLELKALFGSDWKEKCFNLLKDIPCVFTVVKDKNSNIIPIAVGGFQEVFKEDSSIACVWLLSSIYVEKNKKEFFKDISSMLEIANKKYSIIYNYIYVSNHSAKKWLRKFGFKFDNANPENLYVPENFEFFYRRNK